MKKFVMLIAALLLSEGALGATYVYEGLNYVNVSGVVTTDMKPTGSFTTSTNLPRNMPLTEIGPGGLNRVTSWSFNDGINTYTMDNSVLVFGGTEYFSVATGPDGNITDFQIGFMSPPGPHAVNDPMSGLIIWRLNTETQQMVVNSPCQAVTDDVCTSISLGGEGYVADLEAGSWSVVAIPIPANSRAGLLLMVLLLGMVGVVTIRRLA